METLTHVSEALFIRAREAPGDLAFEWRRQALTWQALLDGVLRSAAVLAARGVTPGSRCAIVLPTGFDFVRAFFGTQVLGAVPVPMNPRLTADQLRRRVTGIACAASIGEGPHALAEGVPHVQAATLLTAAPASPRTLPRPAPDDLSHLQLTSGTTGEPRAVMLRHRNVMAVLHAAQEFLETTPRDRLVGWLPLHHDFGLVRFVLGPPVYGCPAALVEPSMAALPAWLDTISRTRATITGGPDIAYRMAPRLVPRDRVDLTSLRMATSGGESVRASSIALFEEHFGVPGRVRPGYGLAEATLAVTVLRRGEALRIDGAGHVSCGTPVAGVRIRIVGDDDADLPAGAAGRILVQGPGVFAGYLDDPEGTAAVLRDGWLHTGDIGAVDADGHLYVHGRRRAMIKRGGAVIAPREIEEAVDALPGVRRSAAVGLAAGDGTERLVVVVETARGLAQDELTELRTAVGDAARRAVGHSPQEVVLVRPGTIPRTSTGKVQYDALRQQVVESLPGGT